MMAASRIGAFLRRAVGLPLLNAIVGKGLVAHSEPHWWDTSPDDVTVAQRAMCQALLSQKGDRCRCDNGGSCAGDMFRPFAEAAVDALRERHRLISPARRGGQ